MNREVEERIVAMYFDNKDFEKNAKTTIDTLGQLKQGLNIEESAEKGFKVFEKIGKNLNFDKANQGLQSIRNKLSGMRGSMAKVFEISETPIRQAEGAINRLRSYIGKVVGFDLASKIVGNVESAFRNLTFAPITAGWDQYQSKMDSVKTIMSSTGASIDEVQVHLEQMTDYANKTIYSLTDMTSNLGKFTNNGVELERATKAMEGIANATADAGQGAQQASMAMYNISQAIGVGKMTTIDWKSLENANIATQKLKNTFLEMASASGRVKKEVNEIAGKKVSRFFLEMDENGKKLDKRIELTTANFREYLSKGWLDKETMLRTFELYAGGGIDENTLKSWGIKDPELIKSLMQIGEEALEAATQVRTFTKMMDALRESVQSGWAKSFELIFGNMEQGTELWTRLSEELDKVLSGAAERRNAMLAEWAGSSENSQSEKKQIENKKEELKAAQDYLNQLISNGDVEKLHARVTMVDKEIEKYTKTIQELKNETKSSGGKTNNAGLIAKKEKELKQLEAQKKELEAREKELTKKNDERKKNREQKKKYQDDIDNYQEQINELQKRNVKDSKGFEDPNLVKKRDQEIEAIRKKQRVLEKKRDALANDDDEIAKTQKQITQYKKEIEELEGIVEEKDSKPKSKYVDEEGNTGREIAVQSLMDMIELIKELGGAVSDAFHNVFGSLDAQKLFSFTVKIRDAVKSLTEWFGKASDTSSRLYKLQKGLQGIFSIVKAGINIITKVGNLLWKLIKPALDPIVDAFGAFGEMFDGLGDMNIGQMISKIGEAFAKLWAKIKSLFSVKDGETDSPIVKWAKGVWTGFKSVIKNWLKEVGLEEFSNKVSEIWNKVTSWEGWAEIGKFFGNVWDWISDKAGVVINWFQAGPNGEESGFSKFINEVWTGISTAWTSIISWTGWEAIGKFFGDIWAWIADKADVVINWFQAGPNGEESGFSKFINEVWTGISTVWTSIAEWDGWEAIGKFFGDIWTWIADKADTAIKWFQPGPNGEESGFSKFINEVWTTISQVWSNVTNWDGWKAIGKFFGDIWSWIADKADVTINWFQQGPNGEESGFSQFIRNVWTTVTQIWSNISNWTGWEAIGKFFGDIWSWIADKADVAINWFQSDEEGKDSGFVTFLKNFWSGVEETWNKMMEWDGWKQIGQFFGDIWGWIMNLFTGGEEQGSSGEQKKAFKGKSNILKNFKTRAKEAMNQIRQVTDAGTGKDAKDVEQKVSVFKSIIDTISDFITKVSNAVRNLIIPKEVNVFLDGLGKFLGAMFEFFGKFLDDVGTALKGDFSSLTKYIIPAIVMIFIKIGEVLNNRYLSKIGEVQTFAQKFMHIAAGMLMIAAAVALLTTIDQTKMWSAVAAIAVIGMLMVGIIEALDKLNGSTFHNEPVTSTERVLNNLISTIGKVAILFVAMKMLPEIIRTIGDVRKELGGAEIGQDILNVLLGLTALIAGVSLTFGILQKLTAGQGLNPAAALSTLLTILEVLGIVLLAFMGGGGLMALIKKLGGEETIDAIIDGINKVGEVLSAIGGAIGGFFGSLFGGGSPDQKAKASADATRTTMNALGDMADAFDMEKISGISRIITMIQSLSNGSDLIDSSKLENFALAMQRIGAGLYEIAKYILEMEGPLSQINDPDSEATQKLRAFIDYTGQLINAIAPLDGIHVSDLMGKLKYLAEDENLRKFVDHINTIMTGLSGLEDPSGGIQFDSLNIVKNLFESIQDGLVDPKLPKFDATPVVDAIVEALKLGDSSIAQIVHDMVQQGLNLNKNPGDGTNGYTTPTETGMFEGLMNGSGLDFTGITKDLDKQLYGEDGKGGILGQLKGFENQIPSMSDMFKDNGWMDFKDEDGNTIDLLSPIQEKMKEVGDTLSTMDPLKVTIVPVFEFGEMTPESIQAQLDEMPIRFGILPEGNKFEFEFKGLRDELGLDLIRFSIEEITRTVEIYGRNTADEIARLGSHMDGIASEVAAMKLYLDTGALVGGITPMIDRELYRRGLVNSRTGTP